MQRYENQSTLLLIKETMKKIIYLFILCLTLFFHPVTLIAQFAGLYASDTINSGVSRDFVYDVAFDNDGYIYVVGQSDRTFPNDPEVKYLGTLLKFSPSGQLVKSIKTSFEDIRAIRYAEDGNLLVAGSGTGLLCNGVCKKDLWVAKLDTGGNVIWGRSFGNPINDGNDIAWTINEYITGNIIISGEVYNTSNGTKLFIATLNQQGDTLWTRLYGTSTNWHRSTELVVGSTGYIYSGGEGVLGNGMLVTKLYGDGVIAWTKSFAYAGKVVKIIEQSNGSLILIGQQIVNNEYYISVMDITETGTVNWAKNYQIINNEYEQFVFDADQKLNGDIYITGYYYNEVNFITPGNKPFILKIDATGNVQWCSHYTDKYGEGRFVRVLPSQKMIWGGIYMDYSDPSRISKQPENWFMQFNDHDLNACFNDVPVSIIPVNYTPVSKFLSRYYGYTTNDPQPYISYLEFYKTDLCGDAMHINDEETSMVEIIPNPFSNYIMIHQNDDLNYHTLEIYNQNGSLMMNLSIHSSTTSVDLSILPDGLYFAAMIGTEIKTLKILKQGE